MNAKTETILAVGAVVAAALVVYELGKAADTAATTGGASAGAAIGDAAGHLVFDGGIIALAGLLLIFL